MLAGGGARRPPRRRTPRTATPRRWADENIERELRAFVGDRRDFPTRAEFERAGRSDLRAAVRDFGGVAYWAQRVGLRLRPGQDRAPYGAQDAVLDTKAVIAAEGHLPNAKRVRELGYPRLSTYIGRCGGVARFLTKHRLG